MQLFSPFQEVKFLQTQLELFSMLCMVCIVTCSNGTLQFVLILITHLAAWSQGPNASSVQTLDSDVDNKPLVSFDELLAVTEDANVGSGLRHVCLDLLRGKHQQGLMCDVLIATVMLYCVQ